MGGTSTADCGRFASDAAVVARSDTRRFRRRPMAKGQKRNSRDQKKPEQHKPMSEAAQSALAALHGRRTVPTPAKKTQAAEAQSDRHGPSRPE